MPIPSAALSVVDGGLGLVSSNPRAQLLLGTCSAGTPNAVVGFGNGDQAKTTLGNGPLVEAICQLLRDGGGGPVFACPVNPSVAGAAAAAVAASGNTSSSVATTSGAAYDDLDVVVKVVAAAASSADGTGQLQYSVDGGITFSQTYALSTSGNFPVPGTGVTVAFGAGTLVKGDSWTFHTSSPSFTTTDLTNALNVCATDANQRFNVRLVGVTRPAGANSAVTHTGTGTSVMTVNAGSYSKLTQHKFVKITAGGGSILSGAITYQESDDAGITYGSNKTIPASGAVTLNDGQQVSFAAGTAVNNDTYDFTGTGTDTTAATAAAAIFGILDGAMISEEGNNRFERAQMDMPDIVDAAILVAAASMASKRVNVCAGFCALTSAINGASTRRPAGWVISARAGSLPPSQDCAEVDLGAVPSVTALYRDEFKTPALDAVGISTLRTWTGRSGFYITNARLMGGVGSDFQYLGNGRVMDVGSAAVYQNLLQLVSKRVRIDKTSGHIYEPDARTIEQAGDEALRQAVVRPGDASDCVVTLDRTVNMLSTGIVKINFRIIGLAYARTVQGSIGFLNPSLAPQ